MASVSKKASKPAKAGKAVAAPAPVPVLPEAEVAVEQQPQPVKTASAARAPKKAAQRPVAANQIKTKPHKAGVRKEKAVQKQKVRKAEPVARVSDSVIRALFYLGGVHSFSDRAGSIFECVRDVATAEIDEVARRIPALVESRRRSEKSGAVVNESMVKYILEGFRGAHIYGDFQK